jgi:hypothetical protein
MARHRKERKPPHGNRKRSFVTAGSTWWESLPGEKIKEALNTVYAVEDSTLDPVIERLAAMTFSREDW